MHGYIASFYQTIGNPTNTHSGSNARAVELFLFRVAPTTVAAECADVVFASSARYKQKAET